MKKTICILICLSMVLALMGCSQSHLSDNGKYIAKNVVKVTEQYLQGDISREDASSKLKNYQDLADALPVPDDKDKSLALFKLNTYVWSLHMNISTYDPEEKIRENLRELKKLL